VKDELASGGGGIDRLSQAFATLPLGAYQPKDAGVFAKEMNCEPEFLQSMRKGRDCTQFACFVRNHTRQPIPLTVQFGLMEREEKLTGEELERLLDENRRRYGAKGEKPRKVLDEETLSRPDLL
jgi:hypothetical protein